MKLTVLLKGVISFIMVLLVIVGLWWLTIFVCIALLTNWWLKKWKRSMRLRISKFSYYPLLLILVLTTAILIKTFVVDFSIVPTPSMEDAINPGDRILFSKIHYGPLLPRSFNEIPWVHILFQSTEGDSSKADRVRMKGFSKIKHNDIIVFDHLGYKTPFVKRCVGLPGDTIQIVKGVVYVNNKRLEEPETIKRAYTIPSEGYEDFLLLCDSLNISIRQPDIYRFPSTFEVSLNAQEYSSLKNTTLRTTLAPSIVEYDSTQRLFPNDSEHPWSKDNWGPIIIPFDGMELPTWEHNRSVYEGLAKKEQGYKYPRAHVFSENYFFALGDNRPRSIDSRYWGLIRESDIIGKVILSF